LRKPSDAAFKVIPLGNIFSTRDESWCFELSFCAIGFRVVVVPEPVVDPVPLPVVDPAPLPVVDPVPPPVVVEPGLVVGLVVVPPVVAVDDDVVVLCGLPCVFVVVADPDVVVGVLPCLVADEPCDVDCPCDVVVDGPCEAADEPWVVVVVVVCEE